MCKTKVVKELAKELVTLFGGRLNSALNQAVNSDEISVKRVDNKGYVVDEKAIYEQKEEVKDAKVVSLDEVE